MRKREFCICENKDADQLRGNREADQRLCFRYTDSTIPLLPKYEISSLQPSSVVVQPGLCRTWSETPKTGFPRTRLNFWLRELCLVLLLHHRWVGGRMPMWKQRILLHPAENLQKTVFRALNSPMEGQTTSICRPFIIVRWQWLHHNRWRCMWIACFSVIETSRSRPQVLHVSTEWLVLYSRKIIPVL